MAADEQKSKNVVVIAVDAGPFSMAAFRKALLILNPAKTVFHFLHVRPSEDGHLIESFSEAVRKYHEENEAKRKRQAEALLETFKVVAEAEGVEHKDVEMMCHSHVYAPQGDPREEICRYCRDVKAALLVLGSRGQGPAARLLMGSVSTYCMSNAPCTVMIDHIPEEEQKTLMQVLIDNTGGVRHT